MVNPIKAVAVLPCCIDAVLPGKNTNMKVISVINIIASSSKSEESKCMHVYLFPYLSIKFSFYVLSTNEPCNSSLKNDRRATLT